MKASVGDRVIVAGRHLGERRRTGRIVEVRGVDGAPPYRVEWDEDGRTTLYFPSYDCRVESPSEATSNESRAPS
ncbi:MAG: DUF1918 domain-containing protein [Actinomycetota bacterium]